MQFLNWIRAALQKTVPFSSPTGPSVGRMRYAPTTEYVLSFEKPPRFRPLRGRLWGVCNTPLQPGTCAPSKNCLVFVPFGAVGWGVFNMSLRPDTCDPSKYRCNFPTEYVRPFEKLSRFRPSRGRGVGVYDTPLQSGTCDPSKYRCDSLTGYVWPFKKLSRFRSLLGRLWGVCNTPLQLGTYAPSKNCPIFIPFGVAGLGVFNTLLQLGTCDSSEYRCNFPTGYVWHFKKLSRFRPLRGRGVGRIQYAPTTRYV